MINWKVRIKNKWFWVAIIPALMMLVKAILSLFGLEIDLTGLSDKLLVVVEAVFAVLAILGIVVDPTTVGIHDSLLAMTYETPNDDRSDI